MKKFAICLLTFILIAIPSPALASDSAPNEIGIQQRQSYEEQTVLRHAKAYVTKLRTVELDGVATTLVNVSLGEPIPIYRYEQGEYVDSGVRKYPLFSGSKLVAFVTAYTNSHGNLATQFSFSLAEEVSDFMATNQEIAFIGDDYAIYATNGTEITKLDDCVTVSDEQARSTDKLSPFMASNSSSLSDAIQTAEVYPKTPLQVSANSALAIEDSDECNVDFVPQNSSEYPNTKICWAATLACVGNYLVGDDLYDAFSLADAYFGRPGNYEQEMHIKLFGRVFRDCYDIDYYQTYANCPNFTFLQECISADMPFVVRATDNDFELGWGHFIVAYGWWQSIDSGVDRFVMYMDPDSTEEFTMGSVDSSGDFEYVTDSGTECYISHSFRGNPYA